MNADGSTVLVYQSIVETSKAVAAVQKPGKAKKAQ